jgi:hypothetical protein
MPIPYVRLNDILTNTLHFVTASVPIRASGRTTSPPDYRAPRLPRSEITLDSADVAGIHAILDRSFEPFQRQARQEPQRLTVPVIPAFEDEPERTTADSRDPSRAIPLDPRPIPSGSFHAQHSLCLPLKLSTGLHSCASGGEKSRLATTTLESSSSRPRLPDGPEALPETHLEQVPRMCSCGFMRVVGNYTPSDASSGL